MKYAIIKHEELENLEEHANRLITLGWIPQGGIAVFIERAIPFSGHNYYYMQAMIKKEQK